jgi:hypothetical protein
LIAAAAAAADLLAESGHPEKALHGYGRGIQRPQFLLPPRNEGSGHSSYRERCVRLNGQFTSTSLQTEYGITPG